MRPLAIIGLVAACNGFNAPVQPGTGGQPLANAGTGSFYQLGATVSLDGTGSFDPDGTIVEYLWSVGQRPTGSMALPVDATAATTSFTPDVVGDYVLQLVVRDDEHNTDTSELRIVSMGSILAVNAGPDAGVALNGTAQLAGTVSTRPGATATYAWTFVSRPPGSAATLANATTLTPTFVADTVGHYVISLEARIGGESRTDMLQIDASDLSSVALGTGIAAYAYTKMSDRIIYVHDVGHAELVAVHSMTGAQAVLDIGTFVPRAVSIDTSDQIAAVAGVGRVVAVAVVGPLVVTGSRPAPGCTAGAVLGNSTEVICFPADGTLAPITAVSMSDGMVNQVPCPVQFPSIAETPSGLYMVDGASAHVYLYERIGSSPLGHWIIPDATAPVVAAGTNMPFAVTGNGVAVNPDGTVRFDLNVPVSAGAFSSLRYELAVGSGNQVKIFDGTSQALEQTVTLPSVNGVAPTVKLVAYSADEHRLIVVARTPAGDIAYTVPQ